MVPFKYTLHQLYFIYLCISTYLSHGLACRRDTCSRQEFFEHPGQKYTGQYMVYTGPWPYRICQRLCRQYPQCNAFIMEGQIGNDKFGKCGLINGDVMRTDFTEHLGYTLYASTVSCPAGMLFKSETFRCYLVLDSTTTWWNAKTQCETLTPGAHLLHVKNDADRLIGASLQGRGLKRWVGSRKVLDGDGVTVVWKYDGTGDIMAYLPWASGQPSSNIVDEQDCLGYWADVIPLFHDIHCDYDAVYPICEL